MSDLRDHLFATLEALRDEDQPMDLARAKAVCEVSQVIINTAKVEVDMVNALAGAADPSPFFEQQTDKLLEEAAARPPLRIAAGGRA